MKLMKYLILCITFSNALHAHSHGWPFAFDEKKDQKHVILAKMTANKFFPNIEDVIEHVVPETEVAKIHVSHAIAKHGKIIITQQHVAKGVALLTALGILTCNHVAKESKGLPQIPDGLIKHALGKVATELAIDFIKDKIVDFIKDKIADRMPDSLSIPDSVKDNKLVYKACKYLCNKTATAAIELPYDYYNIYKA